MTKPKKRPFDVDDRPGHLQPEAGPPLVLNVHVHIGAVHVTNIDKRRIKIKEKNVGKDTRLIVGRDANAPITTGDKNTVSSSTTAIGHDSGLETKLDALSKLIDEYAHEAPGEATKVFKQFGRFRDGATDDEPDPNYLQVTEKGLLEATGTVARLAGPIKAAVMAVLGAVTGSP